MSFQWPEFLWLLAALPALVALYVYLLRRRKRFAVRYSSLTLMREAMSSASWRRHVPPLFILLALMNDNISSRYRQLELPVRKGNSVGIQQRKSEQLAHLSRPADDSFSLRNQQPAPCFLMRGSCRWRGMKTARTDGGDGGASLRISLD